MSRHLGLPRRGIGVVGLVLRGLPFVVAGAGIWFVWSQIAVYGANLVKNREWVAHVEVPTLSALQEAVFKRLVDNGLIWTERRPGLVLLRHTPCTSVTRAAPDTALVRGSPTKKQRHQLIDLLCRSPQGQFIQNEIEAWNLSYELLAIRDNRNVNLPVIRVATTRKSAGAGKPAPAAEPAGRRCTTSNVIARFFVPTGCYENTWEASYLRGAIRTAAPTIPNAEPPPREYAFLATEGVTYPGDWRTLTPFAGDRVRGEAEALVGHYEFTSEVTLGAEPVAIHVAGHVFDMRFGSGNWPRRLPAPGEVLPRLVPRAVQGPGLSAEVDLLCPSWLDSDNSQVCLTPSAREEASAYQITLTSAGRRTQTVRVSFRVLPSLVPASELADADDQRTVTLRRATNIDASCPGPHPKSAPRPAKGPAPEPGTCTLSWLESRSVEQRGETNAQVFLREGSTSLVEPNGILTDAAFENGLADVVGIGPSTFGSLAQALVRARNTTGPVRLTIDPELQKRTRAVLSDNIRCNPRARRANPSACQDATRGTLVVMDADAGPTGGEILAVATWPRMDRGFGAWDLAALDAGQPGDSPIAGGAWRAHDISSMAGSTFKAVTALAAVQRVLESGDEALSAILMGTGRLDELEKRLRIQRADGWAKGACRPVRPTVAGTGNVVPALNAQGKVVRCIGNARESGAPGLLPGGIAGYRKVCGGAPANRFGVCEALAMSSNLFFSGMALYLDAPRFENQRPEPKTALRDLTIARVTRRLFPDGFGQSEPAVNRRRDYPLARGLPFRVARLGASPFILPAENARVYPTNGPRQLDLALNGIGQAVTATPIAMAAAYASIGSRTVIRPTLVPWDKPRKERGDPLEGQQLLDVPQGREADFEKLMSQISRGLNGVITVGTAARAFAWSSLPPQLRDAIFLKTGTATLSEEGDRPIYSAWVAGWVDPPRGIPSGITRRVAISCNIARTRDFGGAACAPIVGALIVELHARRP